MVFLILLTRKQIFATMFPVAFPPRQFPPVILPSAPGVAGAGTFSRIA